MKERAWKLGFRSPMNRQRLHYLLKQSGFYSRMHAYEYLIGFRGSIIGVMIVSPERDTATLYTHVELEPQIIEKLKNCIEAVGGTNLLVRHVEV